MGKDLLKSISFADINDQHFSKKIFSLRIFKILWEIELSFADQSISFIERISLEWRLSNQHQIHDNSCTPNVDFIRMTRNSYSHAVQYDLGSYIVWSTANCMFTISVKLQFRS